MAKAESNVRRTGPALEAMYQFLLWLIPMVEKYPRAQKFTLGDRIEITALDILDSLSKATFTRSRDQSLADANLGLDRLRLMVRLSQELHLIDLKKYEHAAREIDHVGRLIGAWTKAHHAHAA
jgi:23S rRNA-intervening sequence protein